MNFWSWLVVAAIVVVALDRLGLYAERRRWIYYRSRRASPGGVGNALLHAHALLEPKMNSLLEERMEHPSEVQESGDPPSRADSPGNESNTVRSDAGQPFVGADEPRSPRDQELGGARG